MSSYDELKCLIAEKDEDYEKIFKLRINSKSLEQRYNIFPWLNKTFKSINRVLKEAQNINLDV